MFKKTFQENFTNKNNSQNNFRRISLAPKSEILKSDDKNYLKEKYEDRKNFQKQNLLISNFDNDKISKSYLLNSEITILDRKEKDQNLGKLGNFSEIKKNYNFEIKRNFGKKNFENSKNKLDKKNKNEIFNGKDRLEELSKKNEKKNVLGKTENLKNQKTEILIIKLRSLKKLVSSLEIDFNLDKLNEIDLLSKEIREIKILMDKNKNEKLNKKNPYYFENPTNIKCLKKANFEIKKINSKSVGISKKNSNNQNSNSKRFVKKNTSEIKKNDNLEKIIRNKKFVKDKKNSEKSLKIEIPKNLKKKPNSEFSSTKNLEFMRRNTDQFSNQLKNYIQVRNNNWNIQSSKKINLEKYNNFGNLDNSKIFQKVENLENSKKNNVFGNLEKINKNEFFENSEKNENGKIKRVFEKFENGKKKIVYRNSEKNVFNEKGKIFIKKESEENSGCLTERRNRKTTRFKI